jgi:hypothetical protein
MKRILAGLALIGLAAAVLVVGDRPSGPPPAHRALRREAVSPSAVAALPTFRRAR